MKQMLKDFSNLLLVMLWDYVLHEVECLLLERPGHIALSNDTVSVKFQYHNNGNMTAKNVFILLLDATDQTIAKKQLPAHQSQGMVAFECFHFKSAGNYRVRMTSETNNGTDVRWSGGTALLSVEWPVFHIDLNRTSNGPGSSLQVGLFTNEQLCAMNETAFLLQVIFTSNLYELGRLSTEEALGMRTSKIIFLARSQWVEFDCLLTGQEAYVTVLLKSVETGLVITSTGPIDLAHKFGYQLVMAPEVLCKSSVQVFVVSPPCTSISGKMAVYKDALRHPGERPTWLEENILNPGNNRTEFNCTLFDMGKNKYCFDFFNFSSQSHFFPRVTECMVIHRNMETWSMWQPWSPCSVTCGDGMRERHRECLSSLPAEPGCAGSPKEASLCSLEECSSIKPPTPPSIQMGEDQKANNIVTITGISLCLFIIFATVLITLWRKLCRAQKCSASMQRNPIHSPSFRKNSDEENICQGSKQRESFSEGGEAPVNIPLTYRRSLQFAQDDDTSGSENIQANAQKIIPPIFSYRLAQQQLKEMKKKGLTETTKVYHVSQAPLTDTVVDASAVLPLGPENQEETAANKFRIKSPFLDKRVTQPRFPGDRSNSRMDFMLSQSNPAMSPTQTMIRRAHLKLQDNRGEQLDRGGHKNIQFRRTASFHETKKARPFRERSMSTLTPRQAPLYSSRTRTWDEGLGDRIRPKSRGANTTSERLDLSPTTVLTCEPQSYGTKHQHKGGPPMRKLDLISDRQLVGQEKGPGRPELNRSKRGPSPNHRGSWKKETISALQDKQRSAAISPAQYRKDKCQSFPLDPNFAFYDNSTFGLTESEQQMIDLPGYFGSNEEDETSTLSIEKLVV
ncbi:thrombospondin type-1 domain-containing protein 1 [Alligator mississippiensis]|uniref:thrombospondin type-1 domain-containing protein 1 n=1 Tax=Alligator mississippiensis TaxID=8496 RepID=UPI0028779CC9|nr:thrombospondin type-1 domain-containing protein 1 [Alligator mississippiensis]XP_019346948.2 thrombospondin type-1 domain-containing protein 1 [Alligator mississippiensis]XP_019346949.2 thrombospondin type-1 domain-containing protein 1 [Alligator mississippiensis]